MRRSGTGGFTLALWLDQIVRVRRGVRESDDFRGRVLGMRVRDPSVLRPHPRVVAAPDLAALQPPLVLATIHTGPLGALGAILEDLPGEVAIFLRSDLAPRRHAQLLVVNDDESTRVSALAQAARVLRSPGFVFMTLDVEGPTQLEVEVLGHSVSLARGAFALARMADAPVVPLAVRWQGSRVAIEAGQPISPDTDSAMATAFVRWFEQYFSDHPRGLAALSRPLSARGF